MKKLLLSVVLLACTLGAFSQTERGEKSVLFNAGLQTDPTRFEIGAQMRYNIIDNLRVAPEALFIFPKDKITGLDINVNFHYVFGLQGIPATVYPLAGLAMQNNRFSGRTLPTGDKIGSKSFTDWGFNLGAGFGYDISDRSFLNFEAKYTFSDADCFNILFGYGIKF